MRELTLGQIPARHPNTSIQNDQASVRLQSSSAAKTCAWCGAVMAEPYEGGGHGICYRCFTKVKSEAQVDGYIG